MDGVAIEVIIRAGRTELNRSAPSEARPAPGGASFLTASADSAGGGRGPAPRGASRVAARLCFAALGLGAALLPVPSSATAQPVSGGEYLALPEDTAGHEVAGFRMGSWDVDGLPRAPETSYSSIPVVDAFYQRGLGDRTALHFGLSLWRRGQVSGAGTVGTWVGPVFGGVKYYPVGGLEGALDPYLSVAGGPALGFELRRSSGLGSLESGWTASLGAGAEAGGGLELRLGEHLGLTADVQYQWVRYLAGDMNGPEEYRGAAVGAGVTYRLDLR